MSFGRTIIQLRTDAGLSQQEVADILKMARATYASLEASRREPNLTEIKAIAELYQVAPSDLIHGRIAENNEELVPYSFTEGESSITPREVNPELKPEKLREVLLYIIEKVGAKPNVGETVLYKLLYFIDFDYYEKHGKSITGLVYVRNHFGPTPAKSFSQVVEAMRLRGELDIVETPYFNHKQRKYLPTVHSDLQNLNASELEHINDEIARLGDKTATELSEFSHQDTPWIVTKQGEAIDYQFAMYRSDVTSVRELEGEL